MTDLTRAPELTELRWAPYQEFGIPDPAAEQHEAPPGSVTIRAVGYARGGGGDERIVIYYLPAEPQPPRACGCPEDSGVIRHQQATCTDEQAIKLGWFSGGFTGRPVLELFLDTWAELIPDLPDDYECTLTCAEAETAADLFRAYRRPGTADAIMRAHAEHDQPGDAHYMKEGSE